MWVQLKKLYYGFTPIEKQSLFRKGLITIATIILECKKLQIQEWRINDVNRVPAGATKGSIDEKSLPTKKDKRICK
jgi:hypothetical protein